MSETPSKAGAPASATAPSPVTGSSPTRPYIGGQAVLEGVMMRSPTSFAIVARRRDGSLHVRERAMRDGRVGMARLPLVRGVASLVESLKLGGEALRFSAEIMEKDLEAEELAKGGGATSSSDAAKTRDGRARKTSGLGSGVVRLLQSIAYTLFLLMTADGGEEGVGGASPAASPAAKPEDAAGAIVEDTTVEEKKDGGSKGPMGFMLVIMVAFLIALPQVGAAGINKLLKLDLDVQSPAFQAITGVFKLTIVIGYLLIVRSAIPDIRRVFQYHGAEHKTISTYEAGEALTVDNARAKTTLHPRCGTTFLVMVAIVSILVFTAVGGFLPKIQTGKVWLDNVVFFLEKLPFLPLIAAVTFEIQRVFAKYCTTGPLRALLWPGFLCQKITTIEPDDDQLEVALASLRVTLFREQEEAAQARANAAAHAGADEAVPADVRYRNFGALMNADRLRRAA